MTSSDFLQQAEHISSALDRVLGGFVGTSATSKTSREIQMALKSAASGLGFDVDVQIETDQKRCARFSRAAKQLRNFALAGGSYIDNDTIVAMHDAVYTYKDKDIHIPELRAMSARLREHKSGRVEWLMAEAAADQLEHCSKLYSGQEFWVDCTVQVPLAHDIEVKLTLP